MPSISLTPTNFRLSDGATLEVGTAGQALDQFQIVYKDSADSKLKKLDVTDPATSTAFAIIATKAAVDKKVGYVPLTDGVCIESDNADFVKGEVYIGSDVDGEMKLAEEIAVGETLSILFVAVSTTKLRVTLDNTGIEK